MLADVLFLWVSSIPLGICQPLFGAAPYVVFLLRIDHIIKSIWCIFRLKRKMDQEGTDC